MLAKRKALLYAADSAVMESLLKLCNHCALDPVETKIASEGQRLVIPYLSESDADIAVVYGRAYCPFPKYCLPVISLRFVPDELIQLAQSALKPGQYAAVVIPSGLLWETPVEKTDDNVFWYYEEDYDSPTAAAEAAAVRASLLIGPAPLRGYAESVGRMFVSLLPGDESLAYSMSRADAMMTRLEEEYALQSRLDAYMNSTPGCFIEVDRNGRVLNVNERARYQLNLRDTFVYGRYVLNIFPQLDKQMLDSALFFGYSINRHPTGSGGAFWVSLEPVRTGDKIDGAVIYFDKNPPSTSLLRSSASTPAGLRAQFRFSDLVYVSKGFSYLISQAKMLSTTADPVLILGEAGTETSQLAQCIHNEGPREQKGFMEINCDAYDSVQIRAMLLEPFPAAEGSKSGCGIEACRGGTIFLKNIDRLSQELQYVVYTLITGWYLPANSALRMQADVRVIASSERQLRELLGEGKFREDLYYSLSATVLSIPPMRERPGDVRDVLEHFLEKYSEVYGKRITVAAKAMEYLCRYDWPGNTLEMDHFCRKLVSSTPYKSISESFVLQMMAEFQADAGETVRSNEKKARVNPEALLIVETLRRNGGNREKTAEELGLSKTTLWRRMQKYGIINNYSV